MIPLGPGLHPDIPEDLYHADPAEQASLSSSVARILVGRSPLHAWHAHPRLNPAFPKDEDEKNDRVRDIGSGSHALMLGKGQDVVRLPFANYRKDAAKEAAAEARASKQIPLLEPDHDTVQAIVEAGKRQLATSDFAGIFDDGDAELTAVWQEPGCLCRSRIDYLPAIVRQGGHVIVPDYKTTAGSAEPEDYRRTMTEKGHAVQAAFYERGLRTLIPSIKSLEFVFIVQEQEAPYAMSFLGFDAEAMERARQEVEVAIRLWAHCLKAGEWPGYPNEIHRVGVAAWKAEQSEFRSQHLLDRLAKWQAPLHTTRGKAA